MLHLIVPLSVENAIELRDRVAEQKGIWLGHPQTTQHPDQSIFEWYVGDRLLNIADDQLREVLAYLANAEC